MYELIQSDRYGVLQDSGYVGMRIMKACCAESSLISMAAWSKLVSLFTYQNSSGQQRRAQFRDRSTDPESIFMHVGTPLRNHFCCLVSDTRPVHVAQMLVLTGGQHLSANGRRLVSIPLLRPLQTRNGCYGLCI